MRTLGLRRLVLFAFVLLTGCGEDEKPPHLSAGGAGGDASGGRAGGSSGGARSGGASSRDGGVDADIPDGPSPGTGGVPSDAPIIVFPPIESGITPEDAGTPEPRDCSPTGTRQVSASPCLALAEAECTRFESCTPFTLVVGYGDLQSCVAVRQRECEATYASPGQAPILDAVHECAARFINAPCNCVLGETCPALAPTPGTLPNGTPCYDDRQCAGGVCTATPFTCGECTDGRVVGEPCGRETPRCRAGLVCGADLICDTPRVRGQRCSTSDDCARDVVCVNRKCGDHLGVGADCRNDSVVCDPLNGILCDSTQCVQVEYSEATGAGAEAACGPTEGKLTLCSAKSYCDGEPFQPGQCQPRGGVGTQCDPADIDVRPTCLPGLVCDPQTNQCAAAGPITCQ